MPSRWAPSRSVVSKTWKASPRGVRQARCGTSGLSSGSGGFGTNKKTPRGCERVCASAVVRLADALLDNDHAEAETRGGAWHDPSRGVEPASTSWDERCHLPARVKQGGRRRGHRSPPYPEVMRVPAHRALQAPRGHRRVRQALPRGARRPREQDARPTEVHDELVWTGPGRRPAAVLPRSPSSTGTPSPKARPRSAAPRARPAVADLPNFAGAGVDILIGTAEAVV